MSQGTDIHVTGVTLYFLPVRTRVPLKFGPEALTSVTCARVRLRVADTQGRTAEGWGETPLSVQWVWPSSRPYQPRHERLKAFCTRLTQAWSDFSVAGHPLEIGHDFQTQRLPALWQDSIPAPEREGEPMPWLAALVCSSPFDLALHDAFGHLQGLPSYALYGGAYLSRTLADYLRPEEPANPVFRGKYPEDFFVAHPPTTLRAWHLVGGLDPLTKADLTGAEPNDGYPVLLADWIQRDGLKCLKVKLRGTDAAWDFERVVRVGRIAIEQGVDWLSTDFNCTVTDPAYVDEILDRLRDDYPRIFAMILYVEQPFAYELEQHRLDVRSVSGRKPLFLDESAHDWRLVQLGRQLGWTGVALKTCKTQTGAILSACWAKAHGMALMVQDLTNPMLAQIPHVLLAAHVGTIMGVETNAMQFYPEASSPEAAIHPGLYQRRGGRVDLASVKGPGFGYRVQEIQRALPAAAAEFGH